MSADTKDNKTEKSTGEDELDPSDMDFEGLKEFLKTKLFSGEETHSKRRMSIDPETRKRMEKVGNLNGHAITLSIDGDSLLGFFAIDPEDVFFFGESVSHSQVVLECLSSEDIKRVILLNRKKMEGKEIETIRALASSAALTSVLAMMRVNYLEKLQEKEADKKP